MHELLSQQYCGKGTAPLVESDGDHRVPLKTGDVAVIMEQITAIGKEMGVMNES